MAAWDRQPGEPPKGYEHFTVYRDLGPTRTLEKTRQTRGISQHYAEELSERWNWVARCDQWDAHVQHHIDRAFLTEAAKRGKLRANAYFALLDAAARALKVVDLEKATLGQIAAAMKTAAEGMRLEEGLTTAAIAVEVRDVRAVLDQLPAEARREVIRLMAESQRSASGRESPLALPAGVGGVGDREE